MTNSKPIHVQSEEGAQWTVSQLKLLAVNGLVSMFDPARQLFCRRLRPTDQGLVREGVSHRYTLIALLGLHKLAATGTASPISVKGVLDGLLANMDWVNNIGDLGLLLWLCALEAPQCLTTVERHLDPEKVLERFPDGRQGSTVGLAWFLAGLSHRSLTFPEKQHDVRDAAFDTYRRLIINQSELGIFRHVGRPRGIGGSFKARIGNFADQVYPIYAIAKFAQAFHVMKATDRALDCALTICQTQGSLGQWWWRYDSLSGRVVERYPVYSVHQDAMAPLALFALGDAIHSDFGPWIAKGLEWVSGNNELGFDMPDAAANVVWRSIFRQSSKRYWNKAIACLMQREDREPRDGLQVVFECCPYDFGWLLYALADREDLLPTIDSENPKAVR